MLYCEKCKVSVTGKRSRCPLCQRSLIGDSSDSTETFPQVPEIFKQHSLLFKWGIFISIVGVVVCAIINFMIPQSGLWSLFVIGGVMCFWITVIIAVNKRSNIIKSILYQITTISVLCILWDWFIGWHGWSIDFVLPIACINAMLAVAIASKIMKLPVEDFIIYVIIDSFFGIIPIIFVLTGILNTIIPSLICIAISIISLSALLVFEGEKMKAELKRRLHM